MFNTLRRCRPAAVLFGLSLLFAAPSPSAADEPFIPRRQSRPPGPPLSPQEALKRMQVPDGFRVELVAAEPDVINPVAMAFDDRGRLFVTESFEYPRRSPGPGRDRIKILEDTNGDGRFDSMKVFAEGLNIPSAIAVGYGGVWVANAPDILFLEDTTGDDRADRQTVVVTGFGRHDTHELPNAFTWGPDGFLYGLNGVFNRSIVEQDGRKYDFTCAMFRIDPVTHRFELFAEGTSNPWGIAFDHEGEAFISACVIDHLWHLSETGYYHRQGGPYPPHTWKIDSIVSHKHQMAAYCGLEYFDSPAYPAEYRDKLYMGNIHGGCINVDSVTRHGATYRGQGHPDFLTANDVWFMPVAQKVGPDGCLYILDWYDRYHCYQDANADPEGIDRGHGRVYRVVHGGRPQPEFDDLQALAPERWIDLLEHPNAFYRMRAAVLLQEKLRGGEPELLETLVKRFEKAPDDASMRLMTSTVTASGLPVGKLLDWMRHSDPLIASWAVRAFAERFRTDLPPTDQQAAAESVDWPHAAELLTRLAKHDDPRVRLQVAVAAGKLEGREGGPVAAGLLLAVLDGAEDDGHLPRIVWRNLEPRVVADRERIVESIRHDAGNQKLLVGIAPRIATRLLAEVKPDLSGDVDRSALASVLAIADSLRDDQAAANEVLGSVASKLRTGEIRPAAAAPVLRHWTKTSAKAGRDTPAALQLRVFAGDSDAADRLVALLIGRDSHLAARRAALETIAVTRPESLRQPVEQWAEDVRRDRRVDDGWRDALLAAAINRADAGSIEAIFDVWSRLPVGVQAMIAGRMIQRESTAAMLLSAIEQEMLSKDVLGPDQVRRLAETQSPELGESVKKIWGTVRRQDSAERQKVVREMTEYLLTGAAGDPQRGWAVYDRICGQCHVMHGRGYEVGPEITRNGRGNFEQLVVSIFDPSLVIGEAYQSVTVLTVDGRVISGLVLEQSDRRIVLKVQGGKQEVLPMDEADEIRQNEQSLMPDGLEQQMTPQEVADLFALLSLEKPPGAEENRLIPGTPEGLHAAGN